MRNPDWADRALGDIASFEYGVALPAPSRVGDEFPVFGSNGKVGRNRAALVEGPGIIIGRKGTVGALTWSEEDFWPIDTTYFVKTQPSIDRRWLYWAMSNLGLNHLDSSTGVPGLNRNDAYGIRLAVPPIREQRRVGDVLDTLNDQISTTERIVAKMLTSRHGLAERLIAQEVPNAILASALLGTPANGIYKPAHLIGRGALLVGQTAINSDRRVIPSLARRGEVVVTELQRFGLIAGDILVSRVYATLDGVGQPALIEHLGEDSVFESNMMRLRCNGSKADPFFVFQTLLTSSARDHVVRRANLSNQASISQAVLTELPVWLPSIDRQLNVGRAIRSVEAVIEAERARLTKLRALQAGLLDDLLTGRVRVAEGAAS